MNERKGRVYWITGLAGAGKSTIGTMLVQHIKEQFAHVVLLDGDDLRNIYSQDLEYSMKDREISAMRNARLCHYISQQGIIVVCCTISMFHSVRDWNKNNITDYIEVYVKVPMDVLRARNQKGLYGGGDKTVPEKNVWGVDIEFQEPLNPDITVVNDGRHSVEEIVRMIQDYTEHL